MTRVGMGVLIGLGAASVVACDDTMEPVPTRPRGAGGASAGAGGVVSAAGGSVTSAGGSSAGGGSGRVSDPCTAACCPVDGACYSDATKSVQSPGAECLALRDNTGQDHIQLRQSWSSAVAPAGNTIPAVYNVLSGRSELPLNGTNGTPNCNMGNGALGSGGFIQLTDYFLKGDDIGRHYSYVGYSKFVSPGTVADDILNGLCMGAETYTGVEKYRLHADQMSSTAGWPDGLVPPMALADAPWTVKPAKAKRVPADFDIQDQAQRADILKKLMPTGDYGKDGFTGVFFYDNASGYAHGYSNLAWVVVYGTDASTHISIPIREAEPKAVFNHANAPNCVGVYGQDPSVTIAGSCKAPANPKDGTTWGGGDCSKTTGNKTCNHNEGPASTTGYFLITELQQIYSTDLLLTLCVSYPGPAAATADGFYDEATKGCVTAKWDPKRQNNEGLPHGDWCSVTNDEATETCHDAFLSKTFHTFSAANIKLGSNGEPATCPL